MPACSALACDSSWMRALAAFARSARSPLGCGGIAEALLEGVDRDLRGDLAGLRAAHPVGDDEQRRARQQRVLVGAPLATGVGAGVLLGDAQHQSTSNVNSLSPIRTRSPGCSGRASASSSSLR